jgi:hypothetical protein
VFIKVRIFAHDGQRPHIGSGALKLLHGIFRSGVSFVNGDYCILLRHFRSPYEIRFGQGIRITQCLCCFVCGTAVLFGL